MRIAILGKIPPIQGGVSAATYWTAMELAKRGHAVHVISNAGEVEQGFRSFLVGEEPSSSLDAAGI